MNEFSLILKKEQEIKEKIELAKKEADLFLQEKRSQLEKKLKEFSLTQKEKEQIETAKEKKLKAIEQIFQEKTQKELSLMLNIKKEKLNKAVDYLIERILCLK